MSGYKSIEDLDVSGKKVLLRVEFNLPLKDGKIVDNERIIVTLPTINYLLDNGAKLIIMGHFGRPDGKRVEELSFKPVAEELASQLGKQVTLAPDCIGDEVSKLVDKMKSGDVVMLENLRFNSGENDNDPDFTEELGALGDVYVNDGFGAAHRISASVVGVPLLYHKQGKDVAAGYLMQKELNIWDDVVSNEGKKMLVVAGRKLKEKMNAIQKLASKMGNVIIGGVPYNVLQKVNGFNLGDSVIDEKGKLFDDIAIEILEKNDNLLFADEVVVAKKVGKDFEDAKTIPISEGVPAGYGTVDFLISDKAKSKIKSADYMIIFGPIGVIEKGFTKGTKGIAKAIKENPKIKIIIGGGESATAYGALPNMTVSTGGGAAITYLVKKTLPAEEALKGNVEYFKKE